MTGGNSGIGLATTHILLAQGANIVILDIADSPSEYVPSSAKYIQCNVADESAVTTAIESAASYLGHVDILVNCAGVMDSFALTADTTTAEWTKVIGINLNGPFFTMRATIPHLLKNDPKPAPDAPPAYSNKGEQLPPQPPSKGCIVNVVSVAALGGGYAGAAYTTSKHAVLGLSRSTAWCYRDQGIRVNAVLPGAVATNIYANSKVEMNMQGYGVTAGLRELGPKATLDATKVADAIVYLCSAEGMSGSEVVVDGGWSVIS